MPLHGQTALPRVAATGLRLDLRDRHHRRLRAGKRDRSPRRCGSGTGQRSWSCRAPGEHVAEDVRIRHPAQVPDHGRADPEPAAGRDRRLGHRARR